jgi:hypothetical protein
MKLPIGFRDSIRCVLLIRQLTLEKHMPNFIATYDLNEKNSPHFAFLEAAEEIGWVTWIKSSTQEWNRLPNTTLLGDFPSLEEAVQSFRSIKAEAEKKLRSTITLEKWIVVHYSASRFISNEKQPA